MDSNKSTHGSEFPSLSASISRASVGNADATPLARASLARDLEDDPTFDPSHDHNLFTDGDSDTERVGHDFSMAESYRRPSCIVSGPRSTVVAPGTSLPADHHGYLSQRELEAALAEERNLLRDNKLIPDWRDAEDNFGSRLGRKLSLHSFAGFGRGSSPRTHDAERAEHSPQPTERTSLLNDRNGHLGARELPYGGEVTPETIHRKWSEAVAGGQIQTTWQRETKVLAKYSRSLILTFMLQYSLPVASVFTVGHIGKIELGAVSLASMTATISGYSVYQGLATSLDTLCAQAYGSGKKTLVGLQMQRMVVFLWLVTFPVGVIWLFAGKILGAIVPEKETAALAGLYLKILLLGCPGFAAFESGKRFLQAQGLFSANLYVLLVCAPLNAVMNWLFVWHLEWGFVGAPIATAITLNLLPILLFLYVCFVDGLECWGGFDRRALRNWGPMIRLAIPGLIMVVAEFLAFEILTLSASWLSGTHLAAQSVVSTVAAIAYQIPFPFSIAASTRIANLIGASLPGAAKTTAKVAMAIALAIGVLNLAAISLLRGQIPTLFTDEADVAQMVAGVLPLCAAFQVFDALTSNCNGILRGLGRQEIGGYVNLAAYYVIGLPLSFWTCFSLGWGLYGLWAGPALALGLVGAVEGYIISKISWDRAVREATLRNIGS